jgi:hypothetical protein
MINKLNTFETPFKESIIQYSSNHDEINKNKKNKKITNFHDSEHHSPKVQQRPHCWCADFRIRYRLLCCSGRIDETFSDSNDIVMDSSVARISFGCAEVADIRGVEESEALVRYLR